MKFVSETAAIGQLKQIISNFKSEIALYETKAKSCLTCETKGACCLDAHFVNVHVSRLEAAAIRAVLDNLPVDLKNRVESRAESAIERYDLRSDGENYRKTYACPLFERGIGCLVHDTAKPPACIAHACYESPDHLPPDELLDKAEQAIDRLNTRTYGAGTKWLPIPVAISTTSERDTSQN